MKITFIGATHEVTGSCYYLEAAGRKFLVDYGMEQGPDYYENKELPVAPGDLDFVLLTHAHMDHSGNLPALYAKGYQGPIYATEATCNLCDIMLRDSAHIQMFEAEWRNRKGRSCLLYTSCQGAMPMTAEKNWKRSKKISRQKRKIF